MNSFLLAKKAPVTPPEKAPPQAHGRHLGHLHLPQGFPEFRALNF